MNKEGTKVLVLGFDGASPKLIDKWIDLLPTFKAFKGKGVFGETIPPLPAQTPVAWATFMTGNNPGKHGVFSFAFRRRGTYERGIVDPKTQGSKTIWQILSDAGKRVGVINVPMSDVRTVNGFIIPGFLSRSEGIPYPRDLRARIKRKFGIDRLRGDLEIDILEKAQSDPELFFERINQITDEMVEVCIFLIQEEKWDFFMAVFMGTDRIQHFFWKYVDLNHPKFEKNALSKLVKEFYIKIDKIIGRFLDCVDENTFVVVLSDHGFCPVYKEVIVNNYLEEQGFLFTTKTGDIDLEKSKAVSYGYGDVWLNVKGREPRGVIASKEEYEDMRDGISRKLKSIEIDNEKPIRDVKTREQLYWGPYLDQAPDLTIIFNVGWQAARRPEITQRNPLKRYVNDNPRWSGGHDGTHDPLDVPGIIGLIGPGMREGKEVHVHLRDVAPTILNLMGISVLDDIDGKSFLPQNWEKTQSL